MNNIVDARGYSCPKPVMMMVKKINELKQGELTIVVDNDTSRENVCRTTIERGWTVLGVKEHEDIAFRYDISLIKN
ncbi:MAG: sulfurtransferase TusA family protein [bacterium]|nr:sulfurtransferase TusA family protein [Candidatus Margulisiibacteriota bacterium]